MEVTLSPELERELNALAESSGRPAAEWAPEAIQIMVDDLAETRAMLDRRYDELKNGAVESIDGEEFFERLRLEEEELLRNPAA